MNKKTQQEPYLKIPYRIFNITKLGPAEKMLLAHIYSFGEKGCWQSNKTLAEMFMTSPATIRRWLGRIKKYLYVKNPKGYYRTLWVKFEHLPAQKCQSDLLKSANRLAQKCATTNNNTIKENYKRTPAPVFRQEDAGATPSPPLHKGAPALLVERDKEADAAIKHFIQNFGKEKKVFQPMTEEEFHRRKAAQLKALSLCSSDLSRKAESPAPDHQPINSMDDKNYEKDK